MLAVGPAKGVNWDWLAAIGAADGIAGDSRWG